jgi:hypothetical protein
MFPKEINLHTNDGILNISNRDIFFTATRCLGRTRRGNQPRVKDPAPRMTRSNAAGM